MVILRFLASCLFAIKICYASSEWVTLADCRERAKQIAISRLEYYKIRGDLLRGEDEVSKAFQEEIFSRDAGIAYTINGGPNLIQALLSGKKQDFFIQTNNKSIREWINILVLIESTKTDTISKGNFDGAKRVFNTRRNLGESTRGITCSEAALRDVRKFASDASDFDDIYKLFEPHFELSKLAAGDDMDALLEFIEGPNANLAGGAKPSIGRKKKKNTARELAFSAETSSPALEEVPLLTLPAPALAAVTVRDISPESDEHESASGSFAGPIEENDSDSDSDWDGNEHFYLKPEAPTGNVKMQRELAKSTKQVLLPPEVEFETAKTLSLDEKSKISLGRILELRPIKWRAAMAAIKDIISQWGGSINCSLGNGSEVEFWVGSTRFMVHGSHGSDHTMMYPAQMKFMRSGLERAGIRLETIRP